MGGIKDRPEQSDTNACGFLFILLISSSVRGEVSGDSLHEGLRGAGAPIRGVLPLLLLLLHGDPGDHRRHHGGRLPRPRRVLRRHLPQRLPERCEQKT